MNEQYMQVPVSLIERALTSMTTERYDNAAARELEALLSQPTPTAGEVWERAAAIAERDAIGVTLSDLNQFPVVQATGARIAFNIRAEAQRSTIRDVTPPKDAA